MEQSNKPHRATKDSVGKKKKLHHNGVNHKAFAVAAPGKAERMGKRSADVGERKFHVPMVDRTTEDPPPVIVAVVGPPGTGKTTLIRSLVRRFTKNTLSDIKGPITVVSGKRRRLTLIECNNDLNSMMDMAKVADLVLLMIDGNFGFEMETMEFLNILAPHGFPRILGVTTHLDLFKKVSVMRDSKRALKHRFWTEVYAGAKLFYMSGVINGRYPDREVLNLARFISVMKFRPLKWRNEHPYLIADRVVDITHPALIEKNDKVDRRVTFYGYVHGTPLPKNNARVHIAGIGDYSIAEAERLPDPCPTPFSIKQQETDGVRRRKRLDDKMKMIYAPMSDVGGVLIDKDAVYIDVGTQSFVEGAEKGTGEKLVTSLQSSGRALGLDTGKFTLFGGDDEPVAGSDIEGASDLDDEDEELEDDNEDLIDNSGRSHMRSGRSAKPSSRVLQEKTSSQNQGYDGGSDEEEYEFAESDSDLGNYEDEEEDAEVGEQGALKWKENASSNFINQSRKTWNLNRIIYSDLKPDDVIKKWRGEENEDDEEEEDIEDEDFFQKKDETHVNDEDFSGAIFSVDTVSKWSSSDDLIASISERFAKPYKVKTSGANEDEEGDGEGGDDEEVFGDFEDLEEKDSQNGSDSEHDAEDESGTSDASSNDESEGEQDVEALRIANAQKKEKKRLELTNTEDDREIGAKDPEGEDGETWHDVQKAKIAKQLEINKTEFDAMDQVTRDQIEGLSAGAYVRLVVENVPCEFIKNFDPNYPVLIGGLLSNEERFGFMQVRIKRHRWHKKILKTNDPIVVSLGWRRFQTIPIYTTSDSRTRNRMLKYTPEHMHCTATFYGPLVSPNTGFCAVQNVSQKEVTAGFRICATGTTLEVDQAVEIVKKLKLVGYPTKIFKNTAFIKDMFSTSLEVAKFEGAKIKTVSGIRGEIKRALAKPEGHFRATFEDKILMSDIVFLRAWHEILPRKFYNPVTSLLDQNWRGMRLTGEVRAEQGLETPGGDENSRYKKIEREARHFNTLKIPKAIKSNLPYEAQVKYPHLRPQPKETYAKKRAVVVGAEEKEKRSLEMQMNTMRRDKEERARAKREIDRAKYLAKVKANEEKKSAREKREKKAYWEKEGRKRGRSDDGPAAKKQRS